MTVILEPKKLNNIKRMLETDKTHLYIKCEENVYEIETKQQSYLDFFASKFKQILQIQDML